MLGVIFVAMLVPYAARTAVQAIGPAAPTSSTQVPAPAIITSPALRGAQIVSLSAGMPPGGAVHYTTDGSEPTAHSPQYFAPFLVASNLTVKAITISNGQSSNISNQTFTPNVPPNTLVWSDEFDAHIQTPADHRVVAAPNPDTWTYDTGHSGPCDRAAPNTYVSSDGYLHVVARQPAAGVYTSARLKTQGHFGVFYGAGSIRIEARMKLPEGQGMWPAFWTLGDNIDIVHWPACGEQDIMEHINTPTPDWIAGSLHGTNGDTTKHYISSPERPFSAADWHIYGMIWSKAKIAFYVDSPANIYTTVTPADFNRPGAVWPFDSGNGMYLLLNLAVGGDWPKSPDASTKFPSEMLVDYVRIYTN